MQSPPKHIAVIGAGILGASIAYHLIRRGGPGGLRVTLIERSRPAAEATGASFAWINAAFRNPRPYFELRMVGLQDYRRLEQELSGRLRINWGGGLNWDYEDRDIAAEVRRHAAWGYDLRFVERSEIKALEPKLKSPPERAVFSACEASLAPVTATEVLTAAAGGLGAEVKTDCQVHEILRGPQGLTGLETDAGRIAAEAVVLAAGTASQSLAARLGFDLPMKAPPGLLAHSRPMPPLLGRFLQTPGLHMKQDPDGRLVAGLDFGGGPAPNDLEAEGDAIIARMKEVLIGAEALELDRVTLGLRPIPEDGFPAVGPVPGVPGLYLAAMHSGITLAPAIGRFAAMELIEGAEIDLLAPFRPARFARG